MNLTLPQVTALAPDDKAAAAGRKLSAAGGWRDLGRTGAAIWGQCQGSALYQVKVDVEQLGFSCTCPSRKLPCKHVLGLLMLAAETPGAIPSADPPTWLVEWLSKRAASAEKRAAKAEGPAKPVDAAAQAKRAREREDKVSAGLERLDLWLDDIVREGLAGLERKPASYWESQAQRLVDAQARALAGRVEGLGEIPGSDAAWPRRLLAELGRLALLVHAHRRAEFLADGLRADVRQLLGWTISQEELAVQGEGVDDDWLLLAQEVADEQRIRVERNWLVGRETNRAALVMQFSAGGQPFAESFVPGIEFRAQLTFYPSQWPERAALKAREGAARPVGVPLPGHECIAELLDAAARAAAAQPWLDRWFGVLRNVRPIPENLADVRWLVVDSRGAALRLVGPHRMHLLARSGGHPVDLAGLWNGVEFRPLGVADDRGYTPLFQRAG